MKKFVLSEALGAVPDDMLQEAMEVKKRKPIGKVLFRAAACAAMLALLIAVSAFGTSAPYFSVRAYATETDSVELSQKGSPIFVPAYDGSALPSKTDDPTYRPEFDSSLGVETTVEPVFFLGIYLNDETTDYDSLRVYVDDQELEPNNKEGFVGYLFKDGEIGRFVILNVKKNTRLDVIFYDDNGKKLQHYGMSIEPVEGGWLVTLDKTYLSAWRSGILKLLR